MSRYTLRTKAVDEELGGGRVGAGHQQLSGHHAGAEVVHAHILDLGLRTQVCGLTKGWYMEACSG
eukprot:282160-Chlamydomonas_euryale.AAC.1